MIYGQFKLLAATGDHTRTALKWKLRDGIVRLTTECEVSIVTLVKYVRQRFGTREKRTSNTVSATFSIPLSVETYIVGLHIIITLLSPIRIFRICLPNTL